MTAMTITILIGTYNRCDSLAKTLDSTIALEVDEAVAVETLVVDNNSTDRTRDVVSEFSQRYPGRFRYIVETRQGVSHARNAGLREARGDIIAFLDDDATVTPTWLRNLTAKLQNGHWVGAGGRILPGNRFSFPPWFPVGTTYALAPIPMLDLGADAGPLTQAPFGTNMAFHRNMFEKYGGFRTDLDRCGQELISNGDTEFGERLLEAGEPLWYEPSAVVYHPVFEKRLRREYFLAWWFAKGRSDIRQLGSRYHRGWEFAGIPVRLFRQLAVELVRWMITFGPGRRFHRKLKVWEKAGEIVECRSQSKAGNATCAADVV